jgi:hypothetical protein
MGTKSRNKNSKNLGTNVKKIRERKYQKYGNKNYKKYGKRKLHKYGN